MCYDAAVIGAGVIGGMIARELSRYCLSVCLLEKENDVAMGASKANSGIIHGGYDPVPGTLKAKMNAEGINKLYKTAEMLHVPFEHNGSYVCAIGPEQEKTLRGLYERGIENGIDCLKLISGEEARVREPRLSRDISLVLDVPNAGIICPYALTVAAVGNAMDNGVDFRRNFAVAAISREKEHYRITAASGESMEARYVINCAGACSDRISAMAGDDSFTIIPRAGEYLLLDKAEGQTVRHTIFQVPTANGKGILVTPTADHNLLVGPTATPVETPENTEITPEGLKNIMEKAVLSVPDLPFRQVITSFAGIRSSEKNGDFIICPAKNAPHFLNVAAIDSPGLTSCVAIAEYAVQLLQQAGMELKEKSDWNGCREDVHAFRKMDEAQQDAFIRAHPDYGKIICRCETVSEGEIRDAIRRNPGARDVDGVKRRTRAGMGRCQGGFCMPSVMRILSEELRVPREEISKKGADSYIVTGKV